jgi:hypothetical protein
LRRNPLVRDRSASASALTPRPAAQVAVQAVMANGVVRDGKRFGNVILGAQV